MSLSYCGVAVVSEVSRSLPDVARKWESCRLCPKVSDVVPGGVAERGRESERPCTDEGEAGDNGLHCNRQRKMRLASYNIERQSS
jgi:hypothetical protein